MSDTYLPQINRYKAKYIISTNIVEIMDKYSKWLKEVLPTIVQSTMTTTMDGKIFLLITYKQ